MRLGMGGQRGGRGRTRGVPQPPRTGGATSLSASPSHLPLPLPAALQLRQAGMDGSEVCPRCVQCVIVVVSRKLVDLGIANNPNTAKYYQ